MLNSINSYYENLWESNWDKTYKLKPGHYLQLSLRKKSINTIQYWNVYDAYNKPKLTIDFQEARKSVAS